ncbi:SMI1/KNR4 family protein [Buchananella hordeovulneris]|uniref:SMI1/KNR4 family protein n=1 Tax=Buchananella hordeovulneris TaxID=52770 RepID=UPI000F5E60C6|nr:SMI1/KNR4 family protein [Buchananella hordeovulneris]RRD50371.1 SMI1/KNR4 family protein [Buchananella hordeovulneris]
MTTSARQDELLLSPRWRPLRRALDWHAEPLMAEHGCTPDEITALQTRLGCPLPGVLREWLELVGHRLQEVQDIPGRPDTIVRDGDNVLVWTENQDVWRLWSPPGEDPVCLLEGMEAPPATLSQWLAGLVLSDTLVGAACGTRRGPLGELDTEVAGGVVELDDPVIIAALRDRYPELKEPVPPFWDEPWRGDGETVLRGLGTEFIEWMATTPQAYARVDGLLDLEPEGGLCEVVVHVKDLNPAEAAQCRHPNGTLRDDFIYGPTDPQRTAAELADLGQLSQTRLGRTDTDFHFLTYQPERTCQVFAAALAGVWGQRLTIAWRPERVAYFRVAFPPEREAFALPT